MLISSRAGAEIIPEHMQQICFYFIGHDEVSERLVIFIVGKLDDYVSYCVNCFSLHSLNIVLARQRHVDEDARLQNCFHVSL